MGKHSVKRISPYRGVHFSEEEKERRYRSRRGKPFSGKPSDWNGKKHSPESRKKMSEAAIGRIMSVETRRKISEARMGDKTNFWKGGITEANAAARNSLDYQLWRESVFIRDNYTCVLCGAHGVKLNADHIKPFSIFIELRFDINNGRTLCVPCHKNTDTYGSKVLRYVERDS